VPWKGQIRPAAVELARVKTPIMGALAAQTDIINGPSGPKFAGRQDLIRPQFYSPRTTTPFAVEREKFGLKPLLTKSNLSTPDRFPSPRGSANMRNRRRRTPIGLPSSAKARNLFRNPRPVRTRSHL